MIRIIRLYAVILIFIGRPAYALSVFDAANYQQNTLTAVHMAESLVNQATQISNELQMLENQARNLKSLDQSSLVMLQTRLTQLDDLITQAKGLSFDQSKLASEFDSLYRLPGSSYMGTAHAHEQLKAWDRQLYDGLRSAIQAEGLVSNNTSVGLELQDLLSKSEQAEGNLQALQVSNQIAALMVNKLLQLEEIVTLQGRAQHSLLAKNYSKEELWRASSNHIRKGLNDSNGHLMITKTPNHSVLPQLP